MPTHNNRYVVDHPHGWAVKASGSDKSIGVYTTQSEAIKEAKKIVENLGGGKVRVQGVGYKFRDSDTVAPRNDPLPARNKKHQ